jgi:transcription termination factor Rho
MTTTLPPVSEAEALRGVVDAMEFLLDKMHGKKTNKEFFESMNQ